MSVCRFVGNKIAKALNITSIYILLSHLWRLAILLCKNATHLRKNETPSYSDKTPFWENKSAFYAERKGVLVWGNREFESQMVALVKWFEVWGLEKAYKKGGTCVPPRLKKILLKLLVLFYNQFLCVGWSSSDNSDVVNAACHVCNWQFVSFACHVIA